MDRIAKRVATVAVALLLVIWMVPASAEQDAAGLARQELLMTFLDTMLTHPMEDDIDLSQLADMPLGVAQTIAEERLATIMDRYRPMMTAEGLDRAIANRLFDQFTWYCWENDCSIVPTSITLQPKPSSVLRVYQYGVDTTLHVQDNAGLLREEPITGTATVVWEEGGWRVHFVGFQLRSFLSPRRGD